jgi:acetylornithine/succinyldiaminopimelate/putrescine aminotransferase
VTHFDAYTRHVNPALGGFLKLSGRELRFVRGEGSALITDDGRRFDDWVAGFGSANLGHDAAPIREAIRAHLDGMAPPLYSEQLNPYAGALAERLVAAAGPPFEVCFFCNSGAEGVEAAIKTAMAATGRTRIAYAAGGFHGTTLGALACMARGLYREPFEGVLAPFVEVPFGDLTALERAFAGGELAAFLVEPIQIEAGLRAATRDYLEGARAIAHRAGALLLFDEVQTGMGRTGSLFAYQGIGVAPDAFVLAKALGGGIVPIGAAVFREGLWQRAFGSYTRAEIHASTFGGNALCCAAALKSLEILSNPEMLANVRRRGEALFGAIERALAGSPAVVRITHRGLIGGIELAPIEHPWVEWKNLGLEELAGHPIAGALLMERLFRKGILTQVCGHDWSVLRVEPPLTVDEATCARFVEAVAEGVRWLEEMQ